MYAGVPPGFPRGSASTLHPGCGLIPPHGGLTQPVDRNVPAAEVAEFKAKAASLTRVMRKVRDTFRVADLRVFFTTKAADCCRA